MKRLALIALMAITFVVGSGIASADGPKPSGQANSTAVRKSLKDYDGRLLADCSHPVDHERRQATFFERLPSVTTVSMPNGSRKTVTIPASQKPETVESEIRINPALCQSSGYQQGLAASAVRSVTSSPGWVDWTCSGKTEAKRLGIVLYGLYLTQKWRTTPYTNIQWPPPPGRATIETTGWALSQGPVVDTPVVLETYPNNPNAVSTGGVHAWASFTLGVGGGWSIWSRSLSYGMQFGYNYCQLW
jgi:hypothetical protein